MTYHHSNQKELEGLFDQHYGLLVSQAISFKPRNKEELDEYIQIAAIGMIKAINTYDESKSKFATYAIVCIRNSLKNHLRKLSKTQDEAQLDCEIVTTTRETIDEYLPSTLRS